MSAVKWRIFVGAVAGIVGLALTGIGAAQPGIVTPDSGIRPLPDRVFVHDQSKVQLRVPDKWEIPTPYRLRRTSTSSVLGLEKENPRIAVTIVFSPMGKQLWDQVIRATDSENRGDDYATLITVYGKDRIGSADGKKVTTMKVGPYTIYKVLIDGGPDKGDAGALYLFEAGSGDNRWKVRIRAVFPALNREDYTKQVEDVIANFAIATE